MSVARRTIDLDSLILYAGGHDAGDIKRRYCVMEAVAFVAGEPWSDHPRCASKVIGDFLRSWNDAMNDDDRQILVPLVPKLVGTVGTDAQELQRSWMALDWYCRVSAPAWLRLAGLTAEAEAIEATAPITNGESAMTAQEALDVARSAAYKARDAAWDAAWAAAGDAAWDAAGDAAWAAARDAAGAAARDAAGAAARDAAWDAAGDAAWDAAGDAAWDAAWDAAGDAAWDAAGDAAWAAAGDAAWAAARDAAGAAAWAAAGDAAWDAAGDAAWAAARDKLRPTVEALQKSALDLVERMIAVTADGAS